MTSPSALCPGEVIGVRIHTSKAPPTKGLAPRNCPNYSFVVFDNPNAVNQVMQDMVSSNCLLVLLLAYGRFQDVQLGYLVFRVCRGDPCKTPRASKTPHGLFSETIDHFSFFNIPRYQTNKEGSSDAMGWLLLFV